MKKPIPRSRPRELLWRISSVILFVFGGLWGSLYTYGIISYHISLSYQFLFDMESIHENILRAESSQRGYLLNPGPNTLGYYHDSLAQLPAAYHRATLMAQSRRGQLGRLSSLEGLVRDRVGEMGRVIALTRAGERDRAVAALRRAQERDLDRAIVTLIQEIRSEEMALIQERLDYLRVIRGVLPAVLILFCGSTIALVVLPYRDVAEQERVMAEMTRFYRREFEALRRDLGLAPPLTSRVEILPETESRPGRE